MRQEATQEAVPKVAADAAPQAAPDAVLEVIPEAVADVAQLPLLTDPMQVLAVLLGFLGVLFWMNSHERYGRIFKVLPLLVFAYFVPTVFSNLGLIPLQSELYTFVKKYLLPASLLLLTMSVDVPAIMKLGRNAVVLFLGATATIVIGGPLALLVCKGLIPEDMMDEAWRGLSALSGSWIGGTANMVVLQEHAGASEAILGPIIVVDVAVANVWMAFLLWYAGREKMIDERIDADRATLDEVRDRVAEYEAEVARPTDLGALLMICGLAIGGAVLATYLATILPPIGKFISGFTWVVVLVSFVGIALSFTKMRTLEGAGASKVGSVFLYLLVTTIGAKAEFSEVLDPKNTGLVAVGAVWMFFHAILMLGLRRLMKAPIFFVAVGSKANIGGAASAPIVASAFHPALAPVGVLLAVAGYVLGTFAGIACSFLLEIVGSG
ncbi:MAG: DUF819 family protein [Planctomycetota bacterium]|jgi:uncharacterized membrane protein|nr:DUF819 family protein [Planctomycetota bacterium]